MARYEYSCSECGIVEKNRAMGTAESVENCSSCGNTARRIFSAPWLNRTSKRLTAAQERAEASGDEPGVVQRRSEDTTSRPGASPNPGIEKLVGRDAARHVRTIPHPARSAH